MSQEELKEILRLYKDDDIEYYNLCGDLGYDKLLNYINNLKEENQRLNNVLKRIKKYCVDNIYSDSSVELTSGKITDVGYCIDALEDILDILKELKESDK